MTTSTIPTSTNERQLIFILAAIQFTHIMDFMILMPLGPQLIVLFDISAAEFGGLVSAYSATAAITGLASALLLDRFDRTSVLRLFYALFALSTLMCALAPSFTTLLLARMAAGFCGGVMTALVQTIVGDVIPFERRGKAMGTLMAAFSAASVAGVPCGLWLANHFSWHTPFILLACMSFIILIAAWLVIPPLRGHITDHQHKAWDNLLNVLKQPHYWLAITFTITMTATSFIVIPFITLFLSGNLGFSAKQIPLFYLVGGACTLISAPLIGKLSDKFGKERMYTLLACLSIAPLLLFTNLSSNSLPIALLVMAMFMVLISGRMIPAMAMLTQIPPNHQRGAFMSLNQSAQSAAMASAAFIGGLLIGGNDTQLETYWLNGLASATLCIVSILLLKQLLKNQQKNKPTH